MASNRPKGHSGSTAEKGASAPRAKVSPPPASLAGVRGVVRVASDVLYGMCELCQSAFPDTTVSDEELPMKVNHYLAHGFRLLHIGQESDTDRDGDPVQRTVAILGSSQAIPQWTPPKNPKLERFFSPPAGTKGPSVK
jgi:hypothetical protein